MNTKEKMYQNIEKHGQNLNEIFNTGLEPIALCKKLRRLENKAHKLAEDYCNGYINEDVYDIEENEISKKVCNILKIDRNGLAVYPLFVNRDPRGYALKLDDEWVRENNIEIYKDWGGYGIIAPDFNE